MEPAKIDYVRNRRETAKILGVSVRTLRKALLAEIKRG